MLVPEIGIEYRVALFDFAGIAIDAAEELERTKIAQQDNAHEQNRLEKKRLTEHAAQQREKLWSWNEESGYSTAWYTCGTGLDYAAYWLSERMKPAYDVESDDRADDLEEKTEPVVQHRISREQKLNHAMLWMSGSMKPVCVGGSDEQTVAEKKNVATAQHRISRKQDLNVRCFNSAYP
ncbi:hypothetical protein TI39_contig5788g00001 [Zymoseptoria brevis]|uniref:Uncharacterized protein n=1 Tax=Zymoseptoria brevis TaxID=1047168 RepID=A0A0F4G6A7_9PEZI|nr:hypothetical protein TI39_contig5788g00001 [Zymoseptoria brevis]